MSRSIETNAGKLGEFDRHLFNEGKYWNLFDYLGAHSETRDEKKGIRFTVWAPNAKKICVCGNFNDWNRQQHPMQLDVESGIWELFIPGLEYGAIYKYLVTDQKGQQIFRSDPVGFWAEVPPSSASIVFDLNEYGWNDDQWMDQRQLSQSLDRPISVYEVHLGSWRTDAAREHGWMNYRELARQLVRYCQELGFTHVELMPVSEHPYTPSWGYQTVGYYSATSRYGNPHDLMYFIDHCHQHGIGVIVDWVPAHFPRDAHGLRRFDGTALYEHIDPRKGEHPDWGTMIFNYGRPQVSNYLIASALFWLKKYHIDGLRVDAVASMLYLDYSRDEGQWVPNQFGGKENLQAIEFLKEFNVQVSEQYPGVLRIAEESTAWPGVSHPVRDGGLGFDLKWNMGWMNDTLTYMRRPPIHRKFHHQELTFSLVYAFSEAFSLPLSHDEVVHGKRSLVDQMPGDSWQKFANLRLLYSYMWTHPGKKTLFMGNEFGQPTEWNCEKPLVWHLAEDGSHKGLQNLVSRLNSVYAENPCLYETDHQSEGFKWIDSNDWKESTISYIRRNPDDNEFLIVVCNFTSTVHDEFRIGVPKPGIYREVFNSDDEAYGGSGVINSGELEAEGTQFNDYDQSIVLRLPPLGATILKLGDRQ